MTLKLLPGLKFAPLGFPFVDPRTGGKFDGYEKSIKGAVVAIIHHRIANPAIYPKEESQWFDQVLVRQEYYRQLYSKRPELFVAVLDQPFQADPDACQYCGSSDISEILCPTCSGRRVTSRTCRTCGAKLL